MEPAAGDFCGEGQAVETDWDSADEVWAATQGWSCDGMHADDHVGGPCVGNGCGSNAGGGEALGLEVQEQESTAIPPSQSALVPHIRQRKADAGHQFADVDHQPIYTMGMTTGQRFERAVEIMHRLRAPGGCPWDREQTFDSIKKYTVEETYEVLEAIENRDWAELPQELGDLLLQVLFYAEMAGEAGHFTIDNVLDTLSDKLVRRHPHVFGDVEAETPREVLRNWEAIKTQERAQKADANGEESGPKPLLNSVGTAMPALLEGLKLSNKAAHVGFDWPSIDGLFDKLQEEAGELRREVERIPAPGPQPVGRGLAGARGTAVPAELQARLQDEVGDLLFTVVNLARYLEVDPEGALRRTNRKFRRRFGHVEEKLREEGKELGAASLDEMERHWQGAKSGE